MFSGIVEEAASVLAVHRESNLMRLEVRSELDHSGTRVGDSIAIDGVCLTAVSVERWRAQGGWVLSFDVSPETCRRTTLSRLGAGARVNVERSLRLGDRISGHFVFGHVDTVAELLDRRADGDCERCSWGIDPAYRSFLAPKGSIALSGISLTIGEVTEASFSVYIIPHTTAVTNIGNLRKGDFANVEVDMLARYVHSNLACHVRSNPEEPI